MEQDFHLMSDNIINISSDNHPQSTWKDGEIKVADNLYDLLYRYKTYMTLTGSEGYFEMWEGRDINTANIAIGIYKDKELVNRIVMYIEKNNDIYNLYALGFILFDDSDDISKSKIEEYINSEYKMKDTCFNHVDGNKCRFDESFILNIFSKLTQ